MLPFIIIKVGVRAGQDLLRVFVYGIQFTCTHTYVTVHCKSGKCSSYLTVPSDTPGTDSVTSSGTWHCPLRILIIRRASTSLRGALTEAHPRYVSWLNTTLSSSGMGLQGLPSDDDSSAANGQWIGRGKVKGLIILCLLLRFYGFTSALLSSS